MTKLELLERLRGCPDHTIIMVPDDDSLDSRDIHHATFEPEVTRE